MSEKEKKEQEQDSRKEWNEVPDSEPIEFVNFKKKGDSVEGVMHGNFAGKYGKCFTLHSTKNGELLGVPSNAFLVQQLDKVKQGQTIYIELIDFEDTGKGSPAKKFKVLVKP